MERCRNNPRHSLRAFAAFLEMDASSISQIISGKRKVSFKVITRICEKLSVSPAQTAIFLKQVAKKSPEGMVATQANFELIANFYSSIREMNMGF